MLRGARGRDDPAPPAAVRGHGLPDPDLDAAVTGLRLSCGAVAAVVDVVAQGRQTRVASSGTDLADGIALCAAVLATGRELVVEDVSSDPRWAGVAAGRVRAFAAEPLRDGAGTVVGAVSVFWSEPHVVSADERTALRSQTRLVAAVLALREQQRRAERHHSAVQREVERLTAPDAALPRLLSSLPRSRPRVLVAVDDVPHRSVPSELERATAALLERGFEDWARLLEVAVRRDEQRAARPDRDPLTGLLHRATVVERASVLLRTTPTALVLLGVDALTGLNEEHGTSAGDAYLAALAHRLAGVVLEPALLARWTGDEFLVVLPGSGLLAARRVAEALRAVAAGSVDVDGTGLRTTSTAGVAAGRRGSSWEGLLREAGTALRRGKSGGRDRVVVSTPELRRTADREERLRGELVAALRAGELQVHYQPQYRLSSRDVVGVEALVRWPRADGTSVSPAEFVPLAERSGLVAELGGQVLRTACADLATWRRQHPAAGAVRTWVNVSAHQLERPDFRDVVADALADARLPADALGLEVTESVLAPHVAVTRVLQGLRAGGVAVALDDFGTGYSSLGQLRHLPVDVLKADRSFVQGLAGPHGRQAAVLRAVVHVGHALSLEVVAEGVEEVAERDAVTALGCEQAQGFLWSPAVPAVRIPAVSGWAGTVPRPTRSPEGRSAQERWTSRAGRSTAPGTR